MQSNQSHLIPDYSGQRGASLFIVMVVVLLTTLLALWSARAALFNERITGNDADYQRAFEAAQALIRDAQLDILGVQADGITTCAVCRPGSSGLTSMPTAATIFFPESESLKDPTGGDLVVLENLMGTTKCVAAICLSGIAPVDFWQTGAGIAAIWDQGAFYGQYTGATNTLGNPLLQGNTGATNNRARYWVEPLTFTVSSSAASKEFASTGGAVSPNARGFVFRITAVANGLRPGTRAVIQTIFVKQDQPVIL